MLRVVERRAPHRHDRVALILVQVSPLVEDHLGQLGQVLVEQRDEVLRLHALGEIGREARDVAEENGEHLALAAQLQQVGVRDHLRDDRRREVVLERLADVALLTLLGEVPPRGDRGVGEHARDDGPGHVDPDACPREERPRQRAAHPTSSPALTTADHRVESVPAAAPTASPIATNTSTPRPTPGPRG